VGEPVDGVLLLRLVERHLVLVAVPDVATGVEPVGPGEQQLAPRRGGKVVHGVPVQHVDPVVLVAAQTPAELDHHRSMRTPADLVLSTGD
jgi:hypothetical protein